MAQVSYLLRIAVTAFAVWHIQGTSAQDHCWIKYSYDAAGNRMERKWRCENPLVIEGGPKSMAQTSLGQRLTPSSARDLMVLTTEEEMTNATVTLTSGDGRTAHTDRMTGQRAEFDVSAYEAGTYVLVLRWDNDEYPSRFTVIH